jgi:hypothetical protein
MGGELPSFCQFRTTEAFPVGEFRRSLSLGEKTISSIAYRQNENLGVRSKGGKWGSKGCKWDCSTQQLNNLV